MSEEKLKPSIQSVEGKTHIGITGAVLGLAWIALSGINSPTVPAIPVEELLKQAKSVQEIVAIYKIQAAQSGGFNWYELLHGGFNVGALMSLLKFLYKVNSKFVGARTSLKKLSITES